MPRPMTLADILAPSPEVADALAAGRPVVALESTIVSHGLPWPGNLETAQAIEATAEDRTSNIETTTRISKSFHRIQRL